MTEQFLQELPLEFRLLLCCLRTPPNSTEDFEQLTSHHLDWDRFLSWCDRHRVVPQVYGNLSGAWKKALPKMVLRDLRNQFLENTKHAMLRSAALVNLLKRFAERDLPVLSLKGTALALGIYGDLNLRHAGDMDLLIAPEHFDQADHIIRHAGYRNITPGIRHREHLHHLFSDAGYVSDAEGIPNTHRIRIELHWRLTNLISLPMDFHEVYYRSQTTVIAGYPEAVLNPEDRLIYLMTHGSEHAWYRLGWLCDVAQILHRPEILDWPQIVARTRDLGLERVVDQTMHLAHVLLGTPIPALMSPEPETGKQTAYLATSAIGAMLEPNSFLIEWKKHSVTQILKGTIYRLRLHRGIRHKARILRLMLVRPEDWDEISLPRPLFPLYYVLNPILLILRRYRRYRRGHNQRNQSGRP
ncbi:MAG: nucleotidyltransferase family protein [Candidatus Latescibacteria bacterium]|nr:nucleotidyltransferase family protein [Candidatus Latescibacterota bacterium]